MKPKYSANAYLDSIMETIMAGAQKELDRIFAPYELFAKCTSEVTSTMFCAEEITSTMLPWEGKEVTK